MLKCIVIEDQYPAQQILQKYIEDNQHLYLLQSFTDTIAANNFLTSNPVDLIFLDINLPRFNGMEFLRLNHNLPATILTTAFSEFALESYEYNIVDYLLKPFSFERFNQAVTKVVSKTDSVQKTEKLLGPTSNDEIFMKSGHEILKLKSCEIVYIKSDADYTEVITTSKKYLSCFSLKDWLHKLDNNFCQVHKSYIININYLGKISSNKIHLAEKYLIPIGRAYKKSFIDRNVIF